MTLTAFLISLRFMFQSWNANLEYNDLIDGAQRYINELESRETLQTQGELKTPEKKVKIMIFHPKPVMNI